MKVMVAKIFWRKFFSKRNFCMVERFISKLFDNKGPNPLEGSSKLV